MAEPAEKLQEKRKELEAAKEKAQQQLEKVHEAKRVPLLPTSLLHMIAALQCCIA